MSSNPTNNNSSSNNFQYASTAPSISSLLNLPQVQDKKKPPLAATGLATKPVGALGLAKKPVGALGLAAAPSNKAATLKLLPQKTSKSVETVSSLVNTMNITDGALEAETKPVTVPATLQSPSVDQVIKAKVEKPKSTEARKVKQLDKDKHKTKPSVQIPTQMDQFDPAHWRLFVGNLGPEVTDSLLQNTFQNPYPSCSKALIVRDWKSQKSKGYGFVAFADGKEFLRALKEMQGRLKCPYKAGGYLYLLTLKTNAQMKFEQFLNREAVPEWRPKYLNYHLLKDHLRNIPFAQSDKRREEEFFRDARKELKKIDQFYTCKQQELLAKYSSSSLSKKDLIILYTETDFLKSFKSLNLTAVRKILKKFVKVTGGEVAARAFQGEVETFQFWANETVLDALSTRIEELFTLKYSSGDRHRAMRRLRLRNFKNESFHSAAMFAGIFWSLTVAFSVYIATVFHARNSQLIHIYASHFLPLLAFGLFSINSFAFKRSFVNYRFIFQFDKRSALHECQYAALTGLFAFTFVASSLIVLIIRNGDDSFNGPSINFIPLLSVLLVLLNPSPWPWYSARLWIIKTALRIPSSPFFPVTFKDFFINDHLISQAYFFQGILLAFNVESVHWAIKLVPIIPNLTRTLQCLRRYKDTKIMLNLLNASKYSLAIFIIIFRAIFSSKKTSIDILQAASSLFSLYWDIVMDFGLLQVTRDYKSFLLRDQLVVFPYKIVYYYMLLFNCVGRFMWVFSSNTLLSQNNTSLLLAIIEILRRFHWSFLRIEYEHLNNCNSFRAVDDTKRIPEEEEGRTADLFYKDMVSESKPLDDKEGNDEIVDEYDYEMTENSV